MPAQKKLEWVTPRISQMKAEDTLGKTFLDAKEFSTLGFKLGPS